MFLTGKMIICMKTKKKKEKRKIKSEKKGAKRGI